jgi:hypothetical protein
VFSFECCFDWRTAVNGLAFVASFFEKCNSRFDGCLLGCVEHRSSTCWRVYVRCCTGAASVVAALRKKDTDSVTLRSCGRSFRTLCTKQRPRFGESPPQTRKIVPPVQLSHIEHSCSLLYCRSLCILRTLHLALLARICAVLCGAVVVLLRSWLWTRPSTERSDRDATNRAEGGEAGRTRQKNSPRWS